MSSLPTASTPAQSPLPVRTVLQLHIIPVTYFDHWAPRHLAAICSRHQPLLGRRNINPCVAAYKAYALTYLHVLEPAADYAGHAPAPGALDTS
jgi:hypothetical protein